MTRHSSRACAPISRRVKKAFCNGAATFQERVCCRRVVQRAADCHAPDHQRGNRQNDLGLVLPVGIRQALANRADEVFVNTRVGASYFGFSGADIRHQESQGAGSFGVVYMLRAKIAIKELV